MIRLSKAGADPFSTQSREIYAEAAECFASCLTDDARLNDIWHHKLALKGRNYSFDELANCLKPGSRICGDIYDFNYYVDKTILDLDDPITRGILEAGQEKFGGAVQDVEIQGRTFSSKYVASVALATRIVRKFESKGISSPRIMEIGGGVGFLLQAFRKYYGNAATIYAVDLPETLLIQHWLLKHWFPEAPFSYKGTAQRIEAAAGGINLINAHVLNTQEFGVDCVINIHSIMEMEQASADNYLRYAARNLSVGGFVFYENHFGHGSASTTEPSEHVLDPCLGIEAAEIAYQKDTFSVYESFRLFLDRRAEPVDPELKKYVLRLFWNGLNAGFLTKETRLVPDIFALGQPNTEHRTPRQQVQDCLDDHDVRIDENHLATLETSPRLPSSAFRSPVRSEAGYVKGALTDPGVFMERMWEAQSALVHLMSQLATRRIESPQKEAGEVAGRLMDRVGPVEQSEHRTLNVISFLLPLGETEAAHDLVMRCSGRTGNPYWLLRFAQVASLFGMCELTRHLVERIPDTAEMSPVMVAQMAEVMLRIDDRPAAREAAERLSSDLSDAGPIDMAVFARLSAILNDVERFATILEELRRRDDGHLSETLFSLLGFFAHTNHSEPANRRLLAFLDEGLFDAGNPRLTFSSSLLRCRASPTDSARRTMERDFAALTQDYHAYGWAGRELMQFGFSELGSLSLSKSIELKEPNFLHYDFVGSVYLFARLWHEAAECFERAMHLVPYVRYVHGARAYCRMAEDYRKESFLAGPDGLTAIFQRNQDWYSDIAPSVKPRMNPRVFRNKPLTARRDSNA